MSIKIDLQKDFKEYVQQVYGGYQLPISQGQELQRAFYAGQATMLSTFKKLVKEDEEQNVEEAIFSIIEQLEHYASTVLNNSDDE